MNPLEAKMLLQLISKMPEEESRKLLASCIVCLPEPHFSRMLTMILANIPEEKLQVLEKELSRLRMD
jgi:hypothetical protein